MFAVTSAYGAGLTAIIGAIGQTLSSVPAISGNFKVFEPSGYWVDRLMAGLYLGSIGLFFTAAVTLAGAYLLSSSDSGRIWAGKLVLTLTILVNAASVFSIMWFTPSDWPHTILHVVAIGLAGLAVVLKPSASNQK